MNIKSNQSIDPEGDSSDANTDAENFDQETPNIIGDLPASAEVPNFHSVEAIRDKNTPIG
jgi:hypothetical protein